ncbi:MAG: hypothetical protein K6E59_01360, partial [Bacilli bacterium]|nr:hypothetical protein [Bacilli bacterium]
MENGLNNKQVKTKNVALVLRYALTLENPTRAELATRTGLTKMTISNLVTDLIEKGILAESKQQALGKTGRPTCTIALSPDAPKVICLLLDPYSISVALYSLRGEASFSHGYSRGQDTDLDGLLSSALDDAFRTCVNSKVLAVSVVNSLESSEDP